MSLFGGNKSETKQEVANYDMSANTGGDYSPAASGGSIAAGTAAVGGNFTDASISTTTINYAGVGVGGGGGGGGAPAYYNPQGGFGASDGATGLGSPGNTTLLMLGIGAAALVIILAATRK